MKKAAYILVSLVMLTAVSCSDTDIIGMAWSLSGTPDNRFKESVANWGPEHGACLEARSDEYRVYAFSDAHVSSTSRNLDCFTRDFLADDNAAPFALCAGDLISGRDNMKLFAGSVQELMNNPHKQLYIAAGNHDMYFGQWKEFKELFRTSTYWFEVRTPSQGKDLYIALDSASGTLGRMQTEWLEELLAGRREDYRNVIVFTHTNLFMKDYSSGTSDNYTVEETHHIIGLMNRYDVNLFVCGHGHKRDETSLGATLYSTLDALGDSFPQASYAIYTIGKGCRGITYVKL